MDGILEQHGDRWSIRFERRLRHSPEKVWRSLTEPEHLRTWFPDQVVGEWKVGAPLRFVDESLEFDGEVLAVEPQKRLEFRWGTDTIRFEITPSADGCMLTLVDTIDELGKAAHDAAGWHECLDNLEKNLDGTPRPWAPGERWAAVHPSYVKGFGPQASTIGPPAGHEP